MTLFMKAVPRGSLIDYRGFRNKQSLYQYVLNMSANDYLERLNLGIALINRRQENIEQARPGLEMMRQQFYEHIIELYELQTH